jgi:hypothetical protein
MNLESAESTSVETVASQPRPWKIVVLLFLGWMLPPLFVYGPSCFIGTRINLPADLLRLHGQYIPADPSSSAKVKNSFQLLDLVQLGPTARQLAADEYQAGRLAVWNPHIFCGAPFGPAAIFSPYETLYYLFPTPRTLVWMQLLQNVCMGAGTWLFLRKSIGVTVWSGLVASWASPWLGFLIVWQGFTGLTAAVCWLPWLLLLVDFSGRYPFRIWTPLLGLVTALLILSGAPDIAALVLVTTGLRLIWNLVNDYLHSRSIRLTLLSTGSVSAGWLLGLVIASPLLLTAMEYARSGARMQARISGSEERPPVGLKAIWTVVFPEFYGGSRAGLPYLGQYLGQSGNILESSSGGFAGGIAISLILPMVVFSPSRRKETIFWLILWVLGMSWQLAIPVLTSLQRTTPFNMLSWSRWVFVSSFSIIVLISIALDAVLRRTESSRTSLLVGLMGLIMFLLTDVGLLLSIPEPFRETLEQVVRQGMLPGFGVEDLLAIRGQSLLGYLVVALFGFGALAAVIHRLRSQSETVVSFTILSSVMLGELLWFAGVQSRTSDTKDYFPPVAALDELSKLPKGRVIGVECLPANFTQMAGLSDVRGYDAVDPYLITRLLGRAADPSGPSPPYAKTQWMIPGLLADEAGKVRLSPILDMLNLRYLILSSKPLVDWPIVIESDGYWILENSNASPRAFVPKSAEVAADDEALKVMETLAFKPQDVAYLEDSEQSCSEMAGKVFIKEDLPSRVELEVQMDKDGIVVLADSWAPDWSVTVDGKDAKSLRINTAVRGVRVPAGKHAVVWEYWPALISKMLPWSLCCLCISLVWLFVGILLNRLRAPAVKRFSQTGTSSLGAGSDL